MTKDDLRLRWRGIVGNRSAAEPFLERPGDAVLVERGRPRLLLVVCPCGCQEVLPVNLDGRAGPAWRIYRGKYGTSLHPSVWRESGCESHFVIWRDSILLFGRYRGDDDDEDLRPGSQEPMLREAVLSKLSMARLVGYVEIADEIELVPWDVLGVCRALVSEGVAHEGTGRDRGRFGLRR